MNSENSYKSRIWEAIKNYGGFYLGTVAGSSLLVSSAFQGSTYGALVGGAMALSFGIGGLKHYRDRRRIEYKLKTLQRKYQNLKT